MSFVHPALLLGALLFAVPLVIHLLNRQRYKRRPWAAMEFLLAAHRKQRRRLRAENLLLLLLRCAIPVVIALAIARPVLRDAVGPLVGGAVHHVLVLDRSYSMGFKPEGAASPYVRARDLAAELVDGLEGKVGSKVTLVLAGVHAAMPVSDDLNLARVKAKLAALGPPEDAAGDLTEALGQVADLVDDAADAQLAVHVFTDMQARAFGEAAPRAAAAAPSPDAAAAAGDAPALLFADTARDSCERIASRAALTFIDSGGMARPRGAARAANLQLVDLRLDTAVAIARTAVPVLARVRNRSDEDRTVQVALEVDGEQPSVKDLALEAGAEGEVEFLVTFAETGLRWLHASVDGDGLSADNERFLVVRVRDRLRLLLVEGSNETDPDLMDAGHLWQVLDPDRGRGEPAVSMFATKVIDSIEWLSDRERPADYDIVVLANVPRLDERTAAALKQAMLGGTALWVMLGSRVDAASYNQHLGGDGPLPLRLVAPAGYDPGGSQYYTAVIAAPEHPVFAAGFAEEIYYKAFEVTPVYRFFSGILDPARGAAVLARLRDPDQSPLLVTSSFGAGKALFWTSGISRRPDRWNLFEAGMLSFPLLHEAAKWLALPASDPHNVAVGEALQAAVRGMPRDAAVVLPERAGGGKVLLPGDPIALPGGRHASAPYRHTEYSGIYAIELQVEGEGTSQPARLPFAVNPDPADGDLLYLSHEAAREQLGVPTVVQGLPAASDAAVPAGRRDLGIPLLAAALALVAAEAALARSLMRRRA